MHLFHLIKFVWVHPLNRINRWRAISRLLRWQIVSFLLPEALIGVPFVNKTRLYMQRGMTGATGNWYCGLHEIDDMGFVLHVLRPHDLFVDIGANIGSYSVLAAGGTGARGIAIEPIQATFAKLVTNLINNALDSLVDSYRIGISNNPGTRKFTTTKETCNHILASGEVAPCEEIPVTTLDELLREQQPALIKIDVEGHELFVIEGAKKTLSSPQLLAVIMETNGSGLRYGVEEQQIVSLMQNAGFSRWNYDAINRVLQPIHATSVTGNTIFIKDVGEAEKRIKSAPKALLVNGWL